MHTAHCTELGAPVIAIRRLRRSNGGMAPGDRLHSDRSSKKDDSPLCCSTKKAKRRRMVVSFSPLCVSEAFLGPSFFTLTLFLSILTGEQTDMYGVFVCFVHVRTVPYVFLQQRLMSGLICRVAQRSSFNLSFPLSGVKVDQGPKNKGWKLDQQGRNEKI